MYYHFTKIINYLLIMICSKENGILCQYGDWNVEVRLRKCAVESDSFSAGKYDIKGFFRHERDTR